MEPPWQSGADTLASAHAVGTAWPRARVSMSPARASDWNRHRAPFRSSKDCAKKIKNTVSYGLDGPDAYTA